MSTELVELFPALRELKRAEKLYVIQFLVSELAQEESDFIQSGIGYPIWSPYDAFDATAIMLKALDVDKTMEFNVCFYRSELTFEVSPKGSGAA